MAGSESLWEGMYRSGRVGLGRSAEEFQGGVSGGASRVDGEDQN